MSNSNWCFLTCIQVSQEADKVVWYSHVFKNFPQFVVIHTVKSFGVVNEAEVDVFLELSCFFNIGLKLNIQKIKIMASGPITSWQIDRETMETVRAFNFGGSKSTAEGDCSHEIKRHFLLGRKAMTNLDSILKRRDITLRTKVHLVKAMAFPVVMYGYESWTIKKAEHQRIDAFELWCWRRFLRVPWTARRLNLKEINPE